MPIYVEMPKLSDTMTEGTLVRWVKQPGESVDVGDVVAEVETDKATMEMEAFDPGIIHQHLIEEGSKVPLGENIYVLLEEGEEAPSGDAKPPAKPKSEAKDSEPEKKEEAQSQKEEPAAPESSKSDAPAPTSGDRVKASPLAKKIAADKGIDLASLTGTGPGGRIVKKDVESAKAGASKGGTSEPVKSPAAPRPSGSPVEQKEDQRIPLSGMRRVIAERLLESKTTIPHFYATIEIDAGPMMDFRKSLKALGEGSGVEKVTFNDFVLRAMALAAVAVPQANAAFEKDAIVQFGNVHLSVAVAIDDGLVTPVLRNADACSLAEISAQVKDLATRARNKKLKPEEYQGGTMTISNLGAYGVEEFQAIINPPQALILAVGAIVKKPVVDEAGAIVAGNRMRLTLSADHRVVDGAVGAEFLAKIKETLEKPMLLLI